MMLCKRGGLQRILISTVVLTVMLTSFTLLGEEETSGDPVASKIFVGKSENRSYGGTISDGTRMSTGFSPSYDPTLKVVIEGNKLSVDDSTKYEAIASTGYTFAGWAKISSYNSWYESNYTSALEIIARGSYTVDNLVEEGNLPSAGNSSYLAIAVFKADKSYTRITTGPGYDPQLEQLKDGVPPDGKKLPFPLIGKTIKISVDSSVMTITVTNNGTDTVYTLRPASDDYGIKWRLYEYDSSYHRSNEVPIDDEVTLDPGIYGYHISYVVSYTVVVNVIVNGASGNGEDRISLDAIDPYCVVLEGTVIKTMVYSNSAWHEYDSAVLSGELIGWFDSEGNLLTNGDRYVYYPPNYIGNSTFTVELNADKARNMSISYSLNGGSAKPLTALTLNNVSTFTVGDDYALSFYKADGSLVDEWSYKKADWTCKGWRLADGTPLETGTSYDLTDGTELVMICAKAVDDDDDDFDDDDEIESREDDTLVVAFAAGAVASFLVLIVFWVMRKKQE